ncbi:Zinc phosphodiesterase ELAC protein 2 [Linnemannia zychae]|nr:Zinc phosphodiesterase ELAC protein 2 [Linnemannia zychae]
MKAYLQVLSTGTADCPPSIILHFDSQRYMINCGEGTQRLCMEQKVRFSKLKTILFTRTHWDCIGGAPGMLLTLSDVGIRNMRLLGGENLTHAIISTRHFVYRNTMAVDTVEFSRNSGSYRDENLRVTAVQVYPDNFERGSPYEWPSLSTSPKPSSPSNFNAALPIPKHEISPVTGSKRSSDDLSPSESTQTTAVDEQAPKSDAEIRSMILGGMFNLSKDNGGHPLANKKVKRDPRAPAPQTDVDMIEAARAAETTHTCGGAPAKYVNGRFMDLPRTTPNPSAISYICQSADYVGKFNRQAAVDLGVKPGKAFGELVNGKSVKSESGDMVHPHQVISGARPGRVFMVIDCPSTDYISGLVGAKEFERYQGADGSGSDKLSAACIVHFGGHSVLSHPEYKAWMQRFGPETQHIIANEEYCSQKLIWRSQSQSSYKLSALDSNIFPIPYYNNTPAHDLSADLKGLNVKAEMAESMMTYLLEPSNGLERTEVVEPLEIYKNHDQLKNSSKEYLREYYRLAQEAQEEIEKEKAFGATEFPGKDVVLTALGTGSSHPSKYRNVSATLVETQKHGSFLLDTGEGTYGQMFRQFGGFRLSADQASSVDERIKNLKVIFISHLHADHHLGIVTLIDRWSKLRTPETDPLYLIAPLKFNSFLQELSDAQDFGYHNVQYIQSEDIVHWRQRQHDPRYQATRPALMSLFDTSGFKDIQTVDVIHCPWAYGISMTHKDGWKIVYSGDTRPCQNLVDVGKGATVLLHEATFEEEMKEEAFKKRHSTTNEAIMVGEGMEARHTLLTHFSQRYPKIPRFEADDKATIIGLCFDLMSVKLGEIEHLAKFLPALQVLYSPQSEEAMEGEEESNDVELKVLQNQSQ